MDQGSDLSHRGAMLILSPHIFPKDLTFSDFFSLFLIVMLMGEGW